MIKRGLGYRKSIVLNSVGHRLLAARAQLEPLPLPDQSAFVSDIFDQGQAGSCGGFGTMGAYEQFQGAHGIESDLPSPNWLYKIGRLEEFSGLPVNEVPPLQDIGVRPNMLFQAMRALGFVSWKDDPYPRDSKTLYDETAMQRLVNAPIAPRLAELAYDLRGMRWGSLPVQAGLTDQVAQALQARLGVAYGQFVDTAYMYSSGEVIDHINIFDPNGGGHWQTVVAVIDGGKVLKIRSSWGRNSGKDGYYYITRSLFENRIVVGEVQVIDFAPPLETT